MNLKTILVVDDEFYTAEILTFVLESRGYRVLGAFNGRDGLEKLKHTPVDLIILDVMMPIMNGAEMARALRADQGLSQIPVLITSALPQSAVEEMFEHFDGFLRKPFQISAVLESVCRLLGDPLPPEERQAPADRLE
jgi:CheY-like chemotaxis protein